MKKLVILLGMLAVVWAVMRSDGDAPPAAEVAAGVDPVNRIWIERMPSDQRDKFHVFVLVEDRRTRGGAFAHTSAFEGDFTVFEWTRSDANKLGIKMLQTGKTHTLAARVTEKNCKPFDYCLELRGAPRGPKSYGTMRDWIIQPGAVTSMDDVIPLVRGTLGL